IAKQVFEAMWSSNDDADTIIEKQGLKQITDSGAIETMIDEILANNQQQVEQYKAGQEKLLGFFVGQVMKASKGKANPGQVNQILRDKLKD
ncbi:MAG: Asp-tRNA(Asn)/Glu-tRNA(Gln) amidotransferase GatCAB subunit B, partial [Gammaproteobacteria bacterium]